MSSESTSDVAKRRSFNEKENRENHGVSVSTREVDTGAQLAAGLEGELEPEEALRIRRKIDWHILPMMFMLYWVQFMDKTTLGSSAILGIEQDTHLSTTEYNWLGTVFYLSYLVFEYPQNLALQKFPVGKWMSINIFTWSVALACHAACTNFAGLLVVRLILGICEGSITAGFMIVSSMFYTRNEQTLRVGPDEWDGFGSLHIQTNGFRPWQWYVHLHSHAPGDIDSDLPRLMIITGVITFILSVCYWFFFPDSPTNAWFLTKEERVKAVQRIKENQTGVENKHFKMDQYVFSHGNRLFCLLNSITRMIEALRDPKTWIFALFSALDNVPNSLTNQQQLIMASFGFSDLQTTLLSCVSGVVEICTIWTGVKIASRWPNSRAYVGAIYFIPTLIAIVLLNLLPWKDKVGLLFCQWATGINTTGFVIALSWIGNVTSGHTKKVVTNAIMLSAYCIGNAAGPFMWLQKYKPRNHVPWIVIAVCDIACPLLLLLLRFLLARENKRRDVEPADDTYDEVYIERVNEDGKVEQVRVDKEFLDLTDRQNRDFRYVL
ncbi:MFS general substrate transporter [Coniophora puteana RWD-64-598 SS2]|uniref:MFS general substrate transporter n=1 Tax=Coniophora puteana (strain RWD-64-598) TaxID=741705 RepID=A0A5M3M7C5_CONPW|nr:MFS general substrate transporter [Coniophora puteana RWD-64-598 SS2]EIW74735.1 MFS general substrate transporter [Coniophora puteana RWD-64-598 SS2]